MRHSTVLTPPISQWRIDRRGALTLRDADGGPLGPLGRKARAILAYLGTYADEHVGRDRLVELLWADRGEAQARGSLRQSLFEIRRVAPQLVSGDNQHVWIEGRRLLPEEPPLASANGELFADLNGITQEFDEWLRSERAAETSEQWSELRDKVEDLIRQQKGSAALPLILRMQRLDPYNEDCLRLAMRAEAQAGHPAGVQRSYTEFAEMLKCELSVSPALETRELRDGLLAELTTEPQTSHAARVVPRAQRSPRGSPWLFVTGSAAMLASLGLTQSATNAAVPVPTVAILPFEAVGIQPGLADGFSDELLTYLVRNRGLRVIGRTAFGDVRSTPEGLRSFRKELGVEYIVEGRVAPSDGKLRVLVSLVRTKDAKTVWAENFVGDNGKLQSIQAAIGSAVGRSLSTTAPPFVQKTTSGEAYALYLRAKGLIRDRNWEGYRSASELLHAALKADPKFAAAWAQLAANTRLSLENDTFPDPTNPSVALTPIEGAQRALDLDSNLAEAHAIMALCERRRPRAWAHLQKALALEPRDPQTLYWVGGAIQQTGNFRLANDFFRKSASLDPLWKRPIIQAGVAALDAGDRTAAARYLQVMRRGNPGGTEEVEIAFSFAEGDFSEAAAIAVKGWTAWSPWDAGKDMAQQSLLNLGLRTTPFRPYPRELRAVLFGKMPDRAWLVSQTSREATGGTDEQWCNFACWSLARERRWSDIVAIYDSRAGVMGELTNGDPSGRMARISFGGLTALALKKVDRDADAIKVALAAEEAIKFALAKGEVPAEYLAHIAQDEAVLGHHNAALTHLEQAYSMGWRMFLSTGRYMDPADDPTFATLRGNPRFERINRLVKAHKAKELKEYLAFTNDDVRRDT